jgi:hypothetical protein
VRGHSEFGKREEGLHHQDTKAPGNAKGELKEKAGLSPSTPARALSRVAMTAAGALSGARCPVRARRIGLWRGLLQPFRVPFGIFLAPSPRPHFPLLTP